MLKRHLIISGTGRNGTTFLVQLFTALGLDTGFPNLNSAIFFTCNARMEWDLRNPDAPYVVKDPWLCDYLDELMGSRDIVIDHAIIPVRDLYSAAESRRDVARRNESELSSAAVPGGLWHTKDPQQQENVLTHQLYKIIYTIAKRDIPLTLIYFPRFINDPEYLYKKIAFALKEISYQQFVKVFRQVAHPHLVHDFHAGN